MHVLELMTAAAKSCGPDDTVQLAAQIMWDNDCGVVPVVDDDGRVIGMVTDRDICMAACMHGKPLWQIPVSNAMARHVYAVREHDRVEIAEALMRRVRVRRVPVLDANGRLTGILSMNDLARHGHRSVGRPNNGLNGNSIMHTLSAIGESRLDRNAAPSQ